MATVPVTDLDAQLAEAQDQARRHRAAGRRSADVVVVRRPATAGAPSDGVLIFPIRYSTERLEDLLGQARLTLTPHAGDLAVDDVLEQLRTVVEDSCAGEVLRRKWGVQRIVHRRRPIGWLIRRGGHWFAVGMEPASQDTAGKGENAWVHGIAGLIRQVAHVGTPIVVVSEVGRLCRRPKYAAPLEAALIDTRAVVRAPKLPPDFCLADHAEGVLRMLWDNALSEAGIDWSGTVRRLSAGGAGQLGAGRWPFAEKELPRGFRMRRGPYGAVVKPHVTEPVDEFRPVLQAVVELGCGPLSDEELCEELGRRFGPALSTAALIRDHGPGATLADAKHPRSAIRRLYLHMPTYVQGSLTVTGKLGYAEPGLEQLHGMPVTWRRDAEGRDYAEVAHVVRLGTEEAPGDADWWGIDRARALEAFRRRVGQCGARTPRGPRRSVKPLAGYACVVDGTDFRLGGPRSRTYVVQARPVKDGRHEKTGRRVGWRGVPAVAVVEAPVLHRRLAEATVDALERGVEGTLLPFDDERPPPADPKVEAQLRELDHTIADRVEDARVFERNHMAAELLRVEGELGDLRARRAALQGALHATETVGAATTVPAVLAYLKECEGQADRVFCDALREVLTSLVGVAPSAATVRLTFEISVATDVGAVVLPVTVSAPNAARKEAGSPVHLERTEQLARRFLLDAGPLDEVAAEAGWEPAWVGRRIREWLEQVLPSKGLRAAVMDCPIAEARTALGCRLFSVPLPDHIDRRYGRLITEVYTAVTEWPMAWAADTHLRRRSALAYVEAFDEGDGVVFADLCAALGVPHSLGRILLESCAPGGRGAGSTSLDYGACLERTEPWGFTSGRWPEERKRVRLIACPHRGCGGVLDHVLRVPELGAASMLCSKCCRSPLDRQLVFPRSYLRLWEGPRGSDRVGVGRVAGRVGTVEGSRVAPPAAWESTLRRAL